jgi:hypothetical protein
VAGLLEARCEPALLSTVLELLGGSSPRTTLLHTTTTGEMIKSLSLLFRAHDGRTPTDEKNHENVSVMSRIVAQVLFPVANNEEAASTAYGPLFAHLAAGGKFLPATMSNQANILVDFLERGGDMGIVLAAARMSPQPAWLSAKLFALGLHLLGMQEQSSIIIKPSADLAVRLTAAVAKRAGVTAYDGDGLGRLYRHALPLDLGVVLDSSSELTAGRLLQAATKAAILKCGLDELCSVVASLHRHHPHSLEPLVSLILTRYIIYPQYVVDPELFIPFPDPTLAV